MEDLQKKSKSASIFTLFISIFLVLLVSVFTIHIGIEKNTEEYIFSQDQLVHKGEDGYQAILILGSGIVGDIPSPILKERLDTGIYLYKNGIAPKILMSGDNGSIHYDEVSTMRNYALNQGIPSEDIFMDYAGFSTYESMYRAEYIFGIKKMVIVTQEYHLYRAIYIAESMDIDVVGANATKNILSGHYARVFRELFAQYKDFFYTKFEPLPKYLGEGISLELNADEVYK